MKTSEFIRIVEELGYEVVDNHVDYIKVYRDNSSVAVVYKSKVNALYTSYHKSVSDDLFDLCVEYAKTPIEEREEPKKYYLKLPHPYQIESNYLNNINGNYMFANDIELGLWQTKFTQEEIDNLPNQDFIRTLIKEEVECQI